MKCIVTGGVGFIGSHIVDLLLEQGMEVTVVDNLSTGERGRVNPRARFVEADICDLEALRHLTKDANLFFHAAALPRIQPSFEQPVEHELVNVVGTIRCLQAVKGSPVQKFVFSSSSAIYGNPAQLPTTEEAAPDLLNPYALQKYAAEQYCFVLGERYGVPVLSLRYFNVYGPRSFSPKNPYSAYSSVVGIFAHQKKAGKALTVTGDGEQSRDFVHVRDVAQANLAAALSTHRFEAYNVGSGKSTTINEVARLFDGDLIYIPERLSETRANQASIEKIRSHLGWTPRVSLEEGVRLLMEA